MGMREQFEEAYVQHMRADLGSRALGTSAAEIAGLRDGDHYGNRPYLNGCWSGWKMRDGPECLHDETERLGILWTKCLQCGKIMADDEGVWR